MLIYLVEESKVSMVRRIKLLEKQIIEAPFNHVTIT